MKQSEIYKQKQDYNSNLALMYSELAFLYGVLKNRTEYKEMSIRTPITNQIFDLYDSEIEKAKERISQIETEINAIIYGN